MGYSNSDTISKVLDKHLPNGLVKTTRVFPQTSDLDEILHYRTRRNSKTLGCLCPTFRRTIDKIKTKNEGDSIY